MFKNTKKENTDALMEACKNGNVEVVEKLLSEGADVNTVSPNYYGLTQLKKNIWTIEDDAQAGKKDCLPNSKFEPCSFQKGCAISSNAISPREDRKTFDLKKS